MQLSNATNIFILEKDLFIFKCKIIFLVVGSYQFFVLSISSISIIVYTPRSKIVKIALFCYQIPPSYDDQNL